MKKIIFILVCSVHALLLFGQAEKTEDEIRLLEQAEVKAVIEKDSAMLLKLWDKDYFVNSPDNLVVFPGANTLDRPVMRRSRVSFTRTVEQVLLRDGVAFSMGSETVVPGTDQKNAGVEIKRRFTNVWMKRGGMWKLVARHANIICPK